MAVSSNLDEDDTDKNDFSYPVLSLIEKCSSQRGNRLDLCKKELLFLPISLFELKHIQYLYLDSNNLTQLPTTFATSFSLLIWLDIRNNKLKVLPENISFLKNLKNLLLERNELSALPLQLGLLTKLSGLNLSSNPLKFPPKKIIESGTKVILSFLREQLALEQRFGKLDIEDGYDPMESTTKEVQRTRKFVKETYKKKIEEPVNDVAEDLTESNDDSDDPLHHHTARRLSLEEGILTAPPYSINPMTMKSRDQFLKTYVPPLRKRELSSTPVRKTFYKGNGSKYVKDITSNQLKKRQAGMKTTFDQEVEKAETKKFNEKADAIIQKQKNKILLDDWRRQSKDRQRRKQFSKSRPPHDIAVPYGNDLQQANEINHSHIKLVREALENGPPSSVLKALRNKQLESRIQEHVRNIKGWKNTKSLMSAEDEVKVAKSNLDEAVKLQRELDEKRALEYRLRAFTAEDFAPSLHSH